MKEVELKSVVPDPAATQSRIEAAGAALSFAGRLEDRRYDTRGRALAGRDEVLRVRIYRDGAGARAMVDWKGATSYEQGYKVREELSADVLDADTLAVILSRLGYVVTREVDREIVQYELDGATLRLERYPRMDVLLEVEGPPRSIERAIDAAGLPRGGFTADRLADFVRRYEQRTGARAAVSLRELAGDYRLRADDA